MKKVSDKRELNESARESEFALIRLDQEMKEVKVINKIKEGKVRKEVKEITTRVNKASGYEEETVFSFKKIEVGVNNHERLIACSEGVEINAREKCCKYEDSLKETFMEKKIQENENSTKRESKVEKSIGVLNKVNKREALSEDDEYNTNGTVNTRKYEELLM